MQRAHHSISIALLSVAALTALPATAQSLKMKDLMASDKEKVASLGREANQACGSKITFAVNYSSYSHVLEDDNNQRPWAYLANVTDAFKSLCRTEAGKQAIQGKIKSVSVANASAESESLENGTFRYAVPYSGHSPATVIEWLKSNL